MRPVRLLTYLLCLSVLWIPLTASAAEDGEFDPVHHTADAYYLDFLPIGKVELPRILILRSESTGYYVRVYRTTKSALRSGELEAKIETEEGTKTMSGQDSLQVLIAEGKHLDAKLSPVEGNTIVLDLSVTKHLVFALLASGILLAIFVQLANRYKRGIGRTSAPQGLVHNLFETLVIFVRDDIAIPNLGKEHHQRFLPYLLTAFFFILTCNLLGLVPFGATATSNLNITAVLAAFTFILTQVNGSRDHWRHVFWPPGMPVPVKLLLIPTEIMGLFTKPVALAIRLFANLTAGHLVILSLIGMIFTFTNLFGEAVGYGVVPVSLGFTLFVMCLEILIAFIQAYIFTILSALFIGMAIAEHSHSEAH
ncbi:MAG: F0F1 ATP synthase subunit A [Rhodothermaceae bacterium]|nr:F0F1 ATP synthase subunit A [Rhodothermaceae bacterium]MXZ57723.1 F0F1 ATP synthase subunit A [Rhodothermaceae bacterium]MYB91774.1 F0F1 ATP synthase subunit A [Rhodothermaceae bacterium]MYD68983.1 F0F1 ATP synthase subunit A [Rhodothermaceae bacterium]MYG45581.1 F0F1 ATP synthase subunit A [Rhodothermaceae bacterium]